MGFVELDFPAWLSVYKVIYCSSLYLLAVYKRSIKANTKFLFMYKSGLNEFGISSNYSFLIKNKNKDVICIFALLNITTSRVESGFRHGQRKH